MKHLAAAAAALCLGLAASLACGDEGADADEVVLRVDADGWFVVEAAPEGELWEGTGVRCILASPQDRGRRPLAGRLAPGAERPVVWVRDTSGRLGSHEARLVRSALDPRHFDLAAGALHVAFVSFSGIGSVADSRWSEFAYLASDALWATKRGAVARSEPVAQPQDLPSPDAPASSGVAASASVRLWDHVPVACLGARFRSVEAAYRFASEADRLCGTLLAASGDARDYGTLRLALHDLLLPTIWRTNPDAERGVSELLVVVQPDLVRGRLRAAVVLRIVDPELHEMQTRAGVALESKPDHLWRPPRDPFPDERERHNFRRRIADVEIVATDASLLERIAAAATGVGERETAWVEAVEESRGGPEPAAADEAVLYLRGMPAPVTEWVGGRGACLRQLRGLAALVHEWTGLHARPGAMLPMMPAPPPTALWSARWVHVRTDVAGALVRARYDDEGAAASAAAGLRAAAEPRDGTDACRRNLRDLVPLALVERAENDLAERCFVFLGWRPVCPSGGAYSAHPITREVACSAHGTEKSPRAAPARAVPLSEIAVDGRDVTFRWKIDWSRKE